MKTTKFFLMAALALTFAACSNDDNDILNPAQTAKGEGITITATLAPKSGSASMRKVTDGTDKIVAEWAENEGIAIFYTVGSTKYKTNATITNVDANGVATISFTVESGTPDNTECTLVYPKGAANDTGVKDYATLLASQGGNLNADLDVRVGAGKIQTTTPGLDVTTQPAAQYSIFKFTTQNIAGTGITPTKFKVSDSEGNVITTVSPSSSPFYVALPALSASTYWFSATADSKPYIAKATTAAATVAGKYYQTTLEMATVGDVITSDGTFATKGAAGEQAVLAYIGKVDNYFDRFLAIALEDADANRTNWSDALTKAGEYAAAHAITIGGTTYNTGTTGDTYYDQVASNESTSSATATALQQGWRLPSVTDWRYIFAGLCGLASPAPDAGGVKDGMVYGTDPTLRNAINTACGNEALIYDIYVYGDTGGYWSSSDHDADSNHAWYYRFCDSKFCWSANKTTTKRVRAVFAY